MKKNAFTLAEVLITLGIIGIVAAMTLPTLVGNYQKKQMVTQLKKAYSELNQAVKLSEVENGEIKYWDFSMSGKDFFDTYLTQYMKTGVHKVGDIRGNGITYYQISGLPEGSLIGMRDSAYVIDVLSGYQIFLAEESNSSTTNRYAFYIDLNGFKKPNTFGKDIHSFYITASHGILPFNTEDGMYDYDAMTRTKTREGSGNNNYKCNAQGRGMWCTALIMIDGWEIKDDYPW